MIILRSEMTILLQKLSFLALEWVAGILLLISIPLLLLLPMGMHSQSKQTGAEPALVLLHIAAPLVFFSMHVRARAAGRGSEPANWRLIAIYPAGWMIAYTSLVLLL